MGYKLGLVMERDGYIVSGKSSNMCRGSPMSRWATMFNAEIHESY